MEYFFIRFFASSLFLSIPLMGIMIVKKLLKKHIATTWQYKIGFLLFFVLAVPFLPPISDFSLSVSSPDVQSTVSHLQQQNTTLLQNGWAKDFVVSVSQNKFDMINDIILAAWCIGVAALVMILFLSQNKLSRMKCSFHTVDSFIWEILEECKKNMGITSKIQLAQSNDFKTPMIFGLMKPMIVLPETMLKQLSKNEIKYILYHELGHYKNKDIWVNYLVCIFQIVYWFQPLVWLAFRQMRTEREILCDISVLKMIHEDSYVDYGMTMIHFIEKMSRRFPLQTTADMGGTKKQIYKRIENIAEFTKESISLKIRSFFIFLLIVFFVLVQAPGLSAMAQSSRYTKQVDNVTYEDLSHYFTGYEGSFVLLDDETHQFYIYNKELSEQRISPSSTYKIYSALMALEEGVIEKNNSTLQWDGQQYPFEEWNQNQNLESAMNYSVNWYFLQMDSITGFRTIKKYLTEMEYGNCDFSGGKGRFWLQSSLKISPLEQVNLLNKLYHNELGFQKENIDIVKSAIKLNTSGNALLYGKTGSGELDDKNNSGWFIGYIENNGKVYYFATLVKGGENAKGSKASEIALSILKDKNILD